MLTSLRWITTFERLTAEQEMGSHPLTEWTAFATRLGYEDAYYFSRLFRTTMGISPAEFRAAKLGATDWKH